MIAFIDVLFNLLLGLTTLFIIAFLMINPIAETGKVDPPVRLIVEMLWESESHRDMDLWVRGPDGAWIGYLAKDAGYATLERDDVGSSSDSYIINGQVETVDRNYEVVNFVVTPEGEYTINVHYYSGAGEPIEVTVKVTTIQPFFDIKHISTVTLTPKKESTVLSFVMDDRGLMHSMRTDIQIPYRSEMTTGDDYDSGGYDR